MSSGISGKTLFISMETSTNLPFHAKSSLLLKRSVSLYFSKCELFFCPSSSHLIRLIVFLDRRHINCLQRERVVEIQWGVLVFYSRLCCTERRNRIWCRIVYPLDSFILTFRRFLTADIFKYLFLLVFIIKHCFPTSMSLHKICDWIFALIHLILPRTFFLSISIDCVVVLEVVSIKVQSDRSSSLRLSKHSHVYFYRASC